MSSVKSVNMSNITATPQVNADSSEVHGRMRVWYDVYEATALASGSDITVARLPKGAVVLWCNYHARCSRDWCHSSGWRCI
jgi:negative regulator of replication initiation